MGSRNRSTPEKQTLILWALLARDDAAGFQNELKPEPEKADRDALAKEGLINWEKRNRKIWIEVTEKGWAWAADHLDADLPAGSPAGSAILQAWLTRLKAYICAHNVSLAEILRPEPIVKGDAESIAAPSSTQAIDYNTLRARIRQVYLDLTGGRLNTRALLADLRDRIKDVDRHILDEALMRMQREEEASLYQLDNQAEVTDADRAAAIYFGSEPRHILWIEQ